MTNLPHRGRIYIAAAEVSALLRAILKVSIPAMVTDPSTFLFPYGENDAFLHFSNSSETLQGDYAPNPKRYAIYFGSKASIGSIHLGLPVDETSEWEFTPPSSPSVRTSVSSSGSYTGCMTPAQEIASRFRSTSTLYTGQSSLSYYSQSTAVWSQTSQSEKASPEISIPLRPLYRRSRHEALTRTVRRSVDPLSSPLMTMLQFDEAVDAMEKEHGQPAESIPCPRPGCFDQVANVKGLMYHLHIHDIDDRYVRSIFRFNLVLNRGSST